MTAQKSRHTKVPSLLSLSSFFILVFASFVVGIINNYQVSAWKPRISVPSSSPSRFSWETCIFVQTIRGGGEDGQHGRSGATSANGNDDAAAAVGLKSHHKKSNAVGDPDDDDDGDGSDEDDDDDDIDSEFDLDDVQDWDEVYGYQQQQHPNENNNNNKKEEEDNKTKESAKVEMAVEFVKRGAENTRAENEINREEEEEDTSTTTTSGGGVGLVRQPRGFGFPFANRRKKERVDNDDAITGATSSSSLAVEGENETLLQHKLQKAVLQAWLPHIYWPPSPAAMEYLMEHAQQWDASSRARLDRRTLYGGLLLEWSSPHFNYEDDDDHNKNVNDPNAPSRQTKNKKRTTLTTCRTYFNAETSHTLRATLALASQPQWRNVLGKSNRNNHNNNNGIRFYHYYSNGSDGNNNNYQNKDCKTTLSMQETICASLAHCMGAGMVILDDVVLSKVRSDLLAQGCWTEDQAKPAFLLQCLLQQQQQQQQPSLVTVASDDDNNNNNNIHLVTKCATISAAMQVDMDVHLLDDPFDERALKSIQEMKAFEQQEQHGKQFNANHNKKLPLVVFIRVSASPSLLKSKSVVEFLLNECYSPNSTNLLVLGKGVVDGTADPQQQQQQALTPPSVLQARKISSGSSIPKNSQQQQQQQQHPWFGFSPHNQNASGQNDPFGSKRFNIFLARTVDAQGNPGILGAIAPPQAGNIFPQMMALQARERLQNMGDPSDNEDNTIDNAAARKALERWASLLQNQPQPGQPQPQFFNASLTERGFNYNANSNRMPPTPPAVIQETLQRALHKMLTALSEMTKEEEEEKNDDEQEQQNNENGDGSTSTSTSTSSNIPDLHRAFAQVLRNENLQRGIMENLARAAPALSDPKCQGVMLSVYIPPPPNMPQQQQQLQSQDENNNMNMDAWFQHILEKQSEHELNGEGDEKSRQRRVRTMAAAAAVAVANSAQESKQQQQEQDRRQGRTGRHLEKLEAACRPIHIPAPHDPVRARSWEAWVDRELGAALFGWNRLALNEQLEKRKLTLKRDIGASAGQYVGSALRSMLSVRDVTSEMEAVIQLAIEMEAENAQRKSLWTTRTQTTETAATATTLTTTTTRPKTTTVPSNHGTKTLALDPSLDQLLLRRPDDKLENDDNNRNNEDNHDDSSDVLMLHPTTLESALSRVCKLAPSPHSGRSGFSATIVHRTKEETLALAQDKHEKALVSQVVNAQDIGVTYDMIGGLTEVKELLRQSITYPLKYPHLYSEGIAREAVKGVLLFGPPGTGKTMLAKAVATEGGASFLSVDASSVENKWLGESEKNAKAVFTLARRLSPCVVFIDEVDSLLSSREGTSDDSAHGTLTSVKTTMMSEWDGLNSGTNGFGKGADRVIVVGSTNRPFDLDEAVLRRFPRRLLVDLPDLETRKEILEVTLAENRLDPTVNLTQIAERLDGYTGSDIKEVCREAVVNISHEHAKILDQGLLAGDPAATSHTLPQELRPVTFQDFDRALSKLKRSVSETGRELARVWEWNDEYGEIKRNKKAPKMMSMYL